MISRFLFVYVLMLCAMCTNVRNTRNLHYVHTKCLFTFLHESEAKLLSICLFVLGFGKEAAPLICIEFKAVFSLFMFLYKYKVFKSLGNRLKTVCLPFYMK